MGPLMQMIGPTMLGMTAGSMVGHLARRSFGQYDLPIPRVPDDELTIVPANLDEFGGEWSLPPDDLRLWVCLQTIATHAVLGVPHVRARLERNLTDYLTGLRDRLRQPRAAARRRRPRRPERHGRAPVGVLRPRGPARRHPVTPPARAAPPVRGGRHRRGRLRRPHHGHHRPRPAVVLLDGHRGRPPPSGREPTSPTGSSSGSSASSSPRPSTTGARGSWPAWSSGPAPRAWPACGPRSATCPPRPRSTPPACGWPASTSPRLTTDLRD